MAKIPMTEGAIEKCQVAIRMDLELKYRVLRRYGRRGAPLSEAVVGLLMEATEGTKLTKGDLDKVNAEMKANYEKRMAARVRRNTKQVSTIKDYSRFQ